MQLRASEVFDDILPVGRIIIFAKVRLELSAQNLESCTLSNTVRANETEDLTGSRCWQAMKLETVGRVSMGYMGLEIGGEVDDIDCAEWTFLGTDTTSYAQRLRYEGDLGFGRDFDAEATTTDHGTRLLAFLSAFLVSDQLSRVTALKSMDRTFGLHCGQQGQRFQQEKYLGPAYLVSTLR